MKLFYLQFNLIFVLRILILNKFLQFLYAMT